MNDVSASTPAKTVPPGSGRRRSPYFPKGRVLKPEEREELSAIVAETPLIRDRLIEYLHLIQDDRQLPAGGPAARACRSDAHPHGGDL